MGNQIENLAIIQARTGSSRLPGKVFLDLSGLCVLGRVIERVKKSRFIQEVIVATTMELQDLSIVQFCASNQIRVYCGSENDVLDRYYQAARIVSPRNVVRITADCPVLDPEILDLIITRHRMTDSDYTSNVISPTYPDGLDCEIMKYSVLEEAWKMAEMPSEREHVTQYILKCSSYQKCSVKGMRDDRDKRWTLDTAEDYEFLKAVYIALYFQNPAFGYEEILELLDRKPELQKINGFIKRNEGLEKSKQQDFILKHREEN